MNKFNSIISVISTILLKSTLTAAEEGSILHIHINDENNVNSLLNGYKMDIQGDKVTTVENNTVPSKAMVDAINNGSFNTDNKSSGMTSIILIPVFALFCIYVIASVGLLIKKKNSVKSKPKRRSLHFEDDDELSKILVQSPAATAIGNDTLTVRSITKETNIGKNNATKNSKKSVAFLPINHAYKATLPWNPKHLDEIKLKVGDIVCIKKCYSDGYSYGRNVTTRVDGIFPTCCLSTMDESIDQAAIEEWVNSGMVNTKKRTTSLFLNDIAYKI